MIDPSTVEHRFDEIYDVVEDYGADPTGEEDISGALAMAWADDRLIVYYHADREGYTVEIGGEIERVYGSKAKLTENWS